MSGVFNLSSCLRGAQTVSDSASFKHFDTFVCFTYFAQSVFFFFYPQIQLVQKC